MAIYEPPEKDVSAETPAEEKPAVENRWWVDTGAKPKSGNESRQPREDPGDSGPIVGDRFFAVGRDFDQDRAQKELTDSNLNLIRQANPEPGTWAYLSLIEESSSPQRIAKVKRMLRLPKWALGVLVDAGTSIRAIATGDPVGEKVIELSIGSQSSFDAWANGEWIREKVFRSRERALREGSGLMVRHLKNHKP